MIKKVLNLLLLSASLTFVTDMNAQKDSSKTADLFADLDNESKATDANTTNYAYATFKSTRVVNGQSVETIGKQHLDFRIAHRFGTLNSGSNELFGLDKATMRLGVDYGLTDQIMLGVGRSTIDKEIDGYLKVKLLRQSTGKKSFPFTVAYFGGISQTTLKTTENLSGSQRMSFVNQLLIAKKFSDAVSFQISPTFIHLNMVDYKKEKNDLLSCGFAGRVKISKRVALTGEYFYQFDQLTNRKNSLSLGVDIETGGHVFQLHFTNSTGMTERSFITNTTGNWGDGDIHFGFNLTRIFSFAKKSKNEKW